MTARLTSYTHDGYEFEVRDEGPLNGPVVIALHGFPQNTQCWDGVIPHLTEAGYRVLAPLQRGYSPKALPRAVSKYTLDHLVGDVKALADSAKIEKFHLIGHDWGAVVAWLVAASHSDRVASLTALSVPHFKAFVLAGIPQYIRSWYIAVFQIPFLPERMWKYKIVRSIMTKHFAVPESLLPQFDHVLGDPVRARGALNWYRATKRADIPFKLASDVTVPTVFVWSDEDAAISRKAAESCEKYVTGPYTFTVLKGATHWIPEELPKETAQFVIDRAATAPV